jgi:hypothetical protein
MRRPDRVVKVIVEIAVVIIARSANTHISCARKGRWRNRLVMFTAAPPRAAWAA